MGLGLIDADRHIEVTLGDLEPFIGEPWSAGLSGGAASRVFVHDIGPDTVWSRLKRPVPPAAGSGPAGARPGATAGAAPAGGPVVAADLSIAFPRPLLSMGLHPMTDLDVAVGFAYARWLTEVLLPSSPELRGMLYLPAVDAEACVSLVEEFGGRPGVCGAFVTTTAAMRPHDSRYLPVYEALEARGLALAFHPAAVWREPPYTVFDHYPPVWALANPFTQAIYLANWIVHGMPLRFPRLRCAFYEVGLTPLMFVAHRLDNEYLRRPSDAPLLEERPSHYIRRCYFSTQPLEQPLRVDYLRAATRLLGCEHLMYASNLPEVDFDVPEVLDALSFLSPADREAIRHGTAETVFGLAEARAALP